MGRVTRAANVLDVIKSGAQRTAALERTIQTLPSGGGFDIVDGGSPTSSTPDSLDGGSP